MPTIFEIPTDLSVYRDEALTQMCDTATTEYNSLLASMQADRSLQVDENLNRLDALKKFTEDADNEITSRGAAATRMSSHQALAAKEKAADDEAETADDADAASEDDEADDEDMAKGKKGSYANETPRVGDVARNAPKADNDVPGDTTFNDRAGYGKLFAASNVDGFAAGQELKGVDDLAKAILSKVKTFDTLGSLRTAAEPVYFQVATMTRDYPKELSVYNMDSDDETIAKVIDEKRLPGGNLIESLALRRKQLAAEEPSRDAQVAATGWCAPSETDYSTCFQGAIDGLYDAPEVQARRGGIRHNQGIDFTGVFGGGTGFFNLSEAQVIAGVNKTCVEIPCPSFVDDRLGVTGLCITGNILQNRGYPEFVRTWTQAAMVASAHQINSLQIAAVVAGSTAVDLTAAGAATFLSDGSVTSQLLAAVEMAIVDIKYRLRMQRSATLEVVFPWWVLAQFRADMSRQNGGDAIARQNITDAQINSWFSSRGARVQWVYDWQDAFATTDLPVGVAGPGNAVPILGFPSQVKFLVYPSGTWVRAVNDVITLNMIYDSTKLATNQLTQLFTETGWAMMRTCTVSRVYTIGICPTGSTGDQRAVACS